jgi:hypothetical protein
LTPCYFPLSFVLFHPEQLENLDSRKFSFPLFYKEKLSKKNRFQADQKILRLKRQKKARHRAATELEIQ